MPVSPSQLSTSVMCLVRFHPGTGPELKRYRPAIIASGQITQLDERFVLVAPFTTHTQNYNSKLELLVKKNKILEQDSVLLCWYLRVIDVNRIEAILGQLSSRQIKQMQKKMQQLFAN